MSFQNIVYNITYGSTLDGIEVRASSNNNTIYNNTVWNCNQGIYLFQADYNTIIDNYLTDCYYGIVTQTSSDYNNITKNEPLRKSTETYLRMKGAWLQVNTG